MFNTITAATAMVIMVVLVVILLKKLLCYKLDNASINWIRSYLSNII